MPFDPMNYTAPVVDADGEVLLRAMEIIEKNGWWDGSLICAPGSHCIVTAISSLREDLMADNMPLWERLGFGWSWEVQRWNDTPGRTKQEVIARLRTAASGRAPTNKEE